MTHGQPRAGRHRVAGYAEDDVYEALLEFSTARGVTPSQGLVLALRDWKDVVRPDRGVTPRPAEV